MAGISKEQGKRPPIRGKLIDFFMKPENQNRNVTKQELAQAVGAEQDQVSNSMSGTLNAPHYDEFAKHVVIVATGKVWKYVERVEAEAVPTPSEPVVKLSPPEDLAMLGHRREVREHRITRRDLGAAIEYAMAPRPQLKNMGEIAAEQTFTPFHGEVVVDPQTGARGARVLLKGSKDGLIWVARPLDL